MNYFLKQNTHVRSLVLVALLCVSLLGTARPMFASCTQAQHDACVSSCDNAGVACNIAIEHVRENCLSGCQSDPDVQACKDSCEVNWYENEAICFATETACLLACC